MIIRIWRFIVLVMRLKRTKNHILSIHFQRPMTAAKLQYSSPFFLRCFNTVPLRILAGIKAGGFTPHQTINLNLEIDNESNYDVFGFNIRLLVSQMQNLNWMMLFEWFSTSILRKLLPRRDGRKKLLFSRWTWEVVIRRVKKLIKLILLFQQLNHQIRSITLLNYRTLFG